MEHGDTTSPDITVSECTTTTVVGSTACIYYVAVGDSNYLYVYVSTYMRIPHEHGALEILAYVYLTYTYTNSYMYYMNYRYR
jgi:hypothetical protein